jgi:hypothetical protein
MPPSTTDVSVLLRELNLLRERSQLTRRASQALGEQASWSSARSAAVCEIAGRLRDQWRFWRAAMDAPKRIHGGLGGVGWPALSVCSACKAVCLGSCGARAGSTLRETAEAWVQPPDAIRALLDVGSFTLPHTVALCPRCASALGAGTVDTTDEPSTDASRSEATSAVLDLIAEVALAAESLGERMPWLDEQEALELAYEAILDQLASSVPDDELRDLADVLWSLVCRLRTDGVPGRAAADAASDRGAAGHFRPTLRPR